LLLLQAVPLLPRLLQLVMVECMQLQRLQKQGLRREMLLLKMPMLLLLLLLLLLLTQKGSRMPPLP
jgi:hypothetical protein